SRPASAGGARAGTAVGRGAGRGGGISREPMDRVLQNAGPLIGSIEVPGDKSISHRAVLLGAIADGRSEIENFLLGADGLSTIRCMRALGVSIDVDEANGRVVVNGAGLHGLREAVEPLDCGNSGTTMRLLAGLLAGQPFLSILTGDASLS